MSKDTSWVKSIAGKLTALFVVIFILFSLFSLYFIYFFKKEITKQVLLFQEYKIEEESERIDDLIEELLINLKSIYVLKDDLAKNDFSLSMTHIYQLFLIDKSIEEIRIINALGQEVFGASRTGIVAAENLRDVRGELLFDYATSGNIFIGEPTLKEKSTFLILAVPYFDNFNFVGVVCAKIKLDYVFDGLAVKDVLNSGHWHVLDKDGIVLSASDRNRIGADVSKTDIFKKIKESTGKIVGVECPSCIEEHDFETIASTLKQEKKPNFIFVLESNRDRVYESYYAVRKVVIGAVFLWLIIIFLFSYIANLRIGRHFKILRGGIKRFEDGEYGQKIELLGHKDEFDLLAENFNEMSGIIEKTIVEKNEALNRLKDVDILKYNFIKNISHQLRTPINSMLWLLENLTSQLGGALTKEQNDIFKDIYKSIQNINQVINDMILMAEIDDRKISVDRSAANCEDIIASAMFAVQEQARLKKIGIRYEKSKKPLPLCSGDVAKIKMIFVRLLENAIIYSEEGKETVIRSEVLNGSELIFSVSDKGIGIPKEEQQRIFTKFYRATNAYKMMQNSSGLSLYIVKYFVEMHGGKIWFDSKEGDGSTFYFSLPIKQD